MEGRWLVFQYYSFKLDQKNRHARTALESGQIQAYLKPSHE